MEHLADMYGGKQAQVCQNDRKYDQSVSDNSVAYRRDVAG
jgi:hypothetical protein